MDIMLGWNGHNIRTETLLLTVFGDCYVPELIHVWNQNWQSEACSKKSA